MDTSKRYYSMTEETIPAGNVVWELTETSDFSRILPGYRKRAAAAGRRITYITFSDQPVMTPAEGVEVCAVPLTHRFEQFTMAVYQLLLEGKGNRFIIFDCLSDLQTAWATDLMMENFFMVITPVIRRINAIAFYPLRRSWHSQKAISRIRNHAEAVIEVFSDFKHIFIRPEKTGIAGEAPVTRQPMVLTEDGFVLITDGQLEARFSKAVNFALGNHAQESMDSWDRFFHKVRKEFEAGEDISRECEQICEIMMSRDPGICRMVKENFEPTDYFFVKEHMIGTGLIGGKACGMLTARKIIENHAPEIFDVMEPHNSFFIGSDVFYSYIVENGFWDYRVRQRSPEEYFSLADSFADKLMHGSFSKEMEEEFIKLLKYYGPAPIIVRSSSILEDGFGNAFAGKYESVFCAGNGSLEERLKEFEDAIRVVYASTLSKSALDYRLRRGLDNRDEQMALLVMRVSGITYGKYFLPAAAGVGYSYSTYRFLDSLDPRAGMLRLVMGLGTCAVDRVEGSYPRLVSLDKPAATSFKTPAEHHRYSQRNVQVIDLETGQLIQLPFSRIEPSIPAHVKKKLFDHDIEAERSFMDRGRYRDVLFVSCSGLARDQELMSKMQGMMQTIQTHYRQPVDIEFTINLYGEDSYSVNLLQCRPLQVFEDRKRHMIPADLPTRDIFIDCRHTSMGQSQEIALDAIVYVDPIAYYEMPYNQKYEVAAAIGRINWYYQGKKKKLLLMVPGRIGTSSPELGVPTTYSDISEFCAIFEISESRAGYNPELSYGSHIFQDLVENEILYMAVFEDERTSCYKPETISCLENKISSIDEELASLKHVMGLFEMEEGRCMLYHDLYEEHLVVTYRKEQA